LEEREREEFVRLKKVKVVLDKKKNIEWQNNAY
jgi:vacuolar-type H+-ATPase subunit D/Vma8